MGWGGGVDKLERGGIKWGERIRWGVRVGWIKWRGGDRMGRGSGVDKRGMGK